MHGCCTISTVNITYTRLQNDTYFGGWQTRNTNIEVVVVVLLFLLLSFDVFAPTSALPLLFLDKWFGQIYLSVG